MSKKYDYHKEQVKQVLPIDQYGLHVQLRTTVGHTKWMQVTPQELRRIADLIEEKETA